MNINNILLEADLQNNSIDPKVVNLVNTVSDVDADKEGSIDKFVAIANNDFGVKDVNSLKNSMIKWLKYPIIAAAGFAIVKLAVNAINYGSKFIPKILSGLKGSSIPAPVVCLGAFCLMLSFLCFFLYKIYKQVRALSSKKVEGTLSIQEAEQYNKLAINKICLETEMFYSKINRIVYSGMFTEAASIGFMDKTINKAHSMCKEMYAWVRDKIKKAGEFAKKHKFFLIAITVVCGFIFTYFKIKNIQAARELARQQQHQQQLKAKIKNISIYTAASLCALVATFGEMTGNPVLVGGAIEVAALLSKLKK